MSFFDSKRRHADRPINTRLFYCASTIFILFTPGTLSAAADELTSDILRQTVTHFLKQQTADAVEQDTEITVGRIDPRLKLTPCQLAPTAFLAAGTKLQGKLTVGLRCAAPKPWTVYIPAQIKRFANVVAAAHTLPRGTKISAADVMPVRKELSQIHGGYFLKASRVIGQVVTQNIAVGRAIRPQRIKPPIVIHRGEKVAIIASIGALKVKGKGEALGDAAQGELVTVRNSRSKRVIQGIATKPGTVNVQM